MLRGRSAAGLVLDQFRVTWGRPKVGASAHVRRQGVRGRAFRPAPRQCWRRSGAALATGSASIAGMVAPPCMARTMQAHHGVLPVGEILLHQRRTDDVARAHANSARALSAMKTEGPCANARTSVPAAPRPGASNVTSPRSGAMVDSSGATSVMACRSEIPATGILHAPGGASCAACRRRWAAPDRRSPCRHPMRGRAPGQRCPSGRPGS